MSYPWQLALGLNTPTTVTTPNGRIYMPDPANLDIYGGNPNDILQTDGAGGLRWTSMQAGTSVEWDSILNKPLTFPPTVPIAWADVAHPATFPPTLPIPISGVSGLQAALDAKATLPIAQADVVNLVADLALKAPLASPVFTGDPRAPTPALNDNDTSIATTQWVKSLGFSTGNQAITISGDASGTGTTTIPLTVSGLQGRPVAAAAPSQDQVLQWNGSAWTPTLLALSGGTITAVTAGTGLSGGGTSGAVTLNIAASGVTNGLLANMPGLTIKGNANGGSSVPADLTVLQVMAMLGAAPLDSPLFTGDPRAPNPAAGDNDTTIATTAWVKSLGYGGGITALTGDVTATGPGSAAATVTALQGRAVFNTTPGDNQVLQWSLANNRWQPGTVAGAGTVTSISAGSGITVSPSPITGAGTVSLTVPVGVANGGTGLTTIASNAMLVGNGTAALQVVTPGGNGAIWASNGAATPSYRPLSNLIDVMTGGGATGQILIRNTIGFWGALAAGTAGQVLKTGGTSANPSWGAVDLATSGITGVLPVANGGTGQANLPVKTMGFTPEFTGTPLWAQGTSPVIPAAGTNWAITGGRFGGDIAHFQTATAPHLDFFRAGGGTLAAPTAVTSGITLGTITFSGYDNVGWYQSTPASIACQTSENWTSSAHGNRFVFSPTKNGNTTGGGWVTIDNDASIAITGADHARLFINKTASGYTNAIYGQRAGTTRWSVELGSVAAETGTGNTGSDFVVGRFADNGAWLDNPLTISRATGNTVLSGSLTIGYDFAMGGGGIYMRGVAWPNGPSIVNDGNDFYFRAAATAGATSGAYWFTNKSGSVIGGFDYAGWVSSTAGRRCIYNDGAHNQIANGSSEIVWYSGNGSWRFQQFRSDGYYFQNTANTQSLGITAGASMTGVSIRSDNSSLVLNCVQNGVVYIGGMDTGNAFAVDIRAQGLTFPVTAWGTSNRFGFGWNTYVAGLAQITIDNGGAVYALANGSDRRLKDNIATSTFDCLGAVLRMPVREFYWRKFDDPWQLADAQVAEDSKFVRAGVVAQEIYEIFPEGIVPGDDFEDRLGRVWQLEQNVMIAALIGAVQQMHAEIETLKARMH